MIRGGHTFLLALGSALAVSSVSHASDNQGILRALDRLDQSLRSGQTMTIRGIPRIFHATGKGVPVGHWQYARQTSDIVEFRTFEGQSNGTPGIEKISTETLGKSKAILRLEIFLDKKACLNAEMVIARYGLKDTPPPDPNPYASAVMFARNYAKANLSVEIPVQPAPIPETQLNAGSCVSSVRVFAGSTFLPAPKPPVLPMKQPARHPPET